MYLVVHNEFRLFCLSPHVRYGATCEDHYIHGSHAESLQFESLFLIVYLEVHTLVFFLATYGNGATCEGGC